MACTWLAPVSLWQPYRAMQQSRNDRRLALTFQHLGWPCALHMAGCPCQLLRLQLLLCCSCISLSSCAEVQVH